MVQRKDIDTLLDLDGVIIGQAGGCWTKFEVQYVGCPTEGRPHGIRYSLTLHDCYGNRIMGFDNAHAVKSKGNKHKNCKTYDHYHPYGKKIGIPYEFTNAHQLLRDFWIEVDRTLGMLGVIEIKR